MRWTCAPGCPASAQAIGIPGKPAPDPKSAQTRASGASGRSWSESAMWRVHTSSSAVDATMLNLFCQSNSTLRACGRVLFDVNRTGASVALYRHGDQKPPARFCSRRLRGNLFAAPNMRNQQRQSCRSHAIDTASMSDGARTMRLQFLFHLVRQTR